MQFVTTVEYKSDDKYNSKTKKSVNDIDKYNMLVELY